MQHSLLSRVELLFWNFAIRTLSQSSLTRSFLRKAYSMANTSEMTSMGILVAVSGVAGLVTGYLFYFLTLSLR